MVKKYIFIDYDLGKYFLENNPRYVLAKKKGIRYIDIFTNTEYNDYIRQGEETVIEARRMITSRKYITTREANLLLQQLSEKAIEEKTTSKE